MSLAVDVSGLSKKYGDFLALDGLDLQVKKGDIFALLGPNGAGKTTLMRVLTTQFDPSLGTAKVFGKDVVREGDEVKALISYIPQEMSVWTDISGYENLLIYAKIYGMPPEKRKAAIAEVIELMDLGEVADNLVRTYSGGMIRKLELAAAIMIKPKLLFLDEPTIGLDPATRKTVWEKLKKLNKESGVTVFFTTHYMDEADAYADTIGIIDRGRLVKVAPTEELKRSIGTDQIEIGLVSSMGRGTLAKLKAIKGITKVKLEGDLLEIWSTDGAAVLNSVLILLLRNKVKTNKVSITKPTIEEVFLNYVGTGSSNDPHARFGEVKKTRQRIGG